MYQKLLHEKYQGQTPQKYPSACYKPQPPGNQLFRPKGAASKRTSIIHLPADSIRRTNVKQFSMNREKQIQESQKHICDSPSSRFHAIHESTLYLCNPKHHGASQNAYHDADSATCATETVEIETDRNSKNLDR